MVRKKVDPRIRTLIENGVKSNHRSLFVLVGDHGRDQVVNLHYILSKARVASRPSVLWCYKKELGFSTHRKKRMRQLKRQKSSGLGQEAGDDNPFELFMTSTNIRWSYYKDSHKVLGQTFGMCVLQDFEALTPNLLARTIETIEGGGIVCLLLSTVNSLQQLFTMTMDVHDRFRTESHADIVPRFNERFMLSLGGCETCLVCDDELNVLPLTSHARNISPLPTMDHSDSEDQKELRALMESLADTQPIGSLVEGTRTVDQARALLTFMEAISEKTLRSTVVLTASRGRGKSAAIGLCLAGAIASGYSNIFVTAPSPENLGTVFEFVLKGLELAKYQEHTDYEVIQSLNPDFNRAIVRVNVYRDHRQTIQYIQPHDSAALSHAELVAIDEAAAIPLPLVKNLLGPYLVFMSSTVNGYEGTGRALSLKLVEQLRKDTVGRGAAVAAASAAAGEIKGSGKKKGREQIHEQRWKRESEAAAALAAGNAVAGARQLREVSLETPIRYSAHDPVEKWLNSVLCLDTKAGGHRLVMGTPAPSDCELYCVNRDALFSGHALSEAFLQRLMALYTAAHYRNQPNDLQMLSDAPAHNLFVLLGPRGKQKPGELPDILCVVQVALEGLISQESMKASLSRGQRASGDLIPWTLTQQFQDSGFPQLSGGRIVRVATHPDVQAMGYGSQAVKLLTQLFEGKLAELPLEDGQGQNGTEQESESEKEDEDSEEEEGESDEDDSEGSNGAEGTKSSSALAKQRLKPRKKLPPLLLPAGQHPTPRLHWLGVSYGVTGQLLRFWDRCGFNLVYMRQTANELTAEHTGIMLKELTTEGVLDAPEKGWLLALESDCRRRMLNLLSHHFGGLPMVTALTLVYDRRKQTQEVQSTITSHELRFLLSAHDMKRLELYARNMVDYHLITDLLPTVARTFFLGHLPGVSLSYAQAAILLGLGIQNRDVEEVASQLQLPVTQVLALFNKAVRKLCSALRAVEEGQAAAELDAANPKAARLALAKVANEKMQMLPDRIDDELQGGAKEAMKTLKKKDTLQMESLKALDLDEYVVKGTDEDWEAALASKDPTKGIQVKTKRVAPAASDDSAPGKKRIMEDGHVDMDKAQKKHKKKKKDKKKGK